MTVARGLLRRNLATKFFKASHCYATASLPLPLPPYLHVLGGWKSRTAGPLRGVLHALGLHARLAACVRALLWIFTHLAASCGRPAMWRHRGDSQGQDSRGRVDDGHVVVSRREEHGEGAWHGLMSRLGVASRLAASCRRPAMRRHRGDSQGQDSRGRVDDGHAVVSRREE